MRIFYKVEFNMLFKIICALQKSIVRIKSISNIMREINVESIAIAVIEASAISIITKLIQLADYRIDAALGCFCFFEFFTKHVDSPFFAVRLISLFFIG